MNQLKIVVTFEKDGCKEESGCIYSDIPIASANKLKNNKGQIAEGVRDLIVTSLLEKTDCL